MAETYKTHVMLSLICFSLIFWLYSFHFFVRLKSFQTSPPGLPDGIFQTKNPNLGKFWKGLKWKMLGYFMASGNLLQPFVELVVIWYIFPVLVYCIEKNLATLLHRSVLFTYMRHQAIISFFPI
jgi:hypothetical protein